MIKKIGIILLLVLAVPTSLAGMAFAQLQDDGQPCPPECVTDTMEIVTWYPSPYSEYEELRLYPKRNNEESQCNSSEQLGLIYYNKDDQALKVCWQDPSNNNYSWEKIALGQGGYWQLPVSGNNIYNTNSGNVGVGTINPSSKFTVNGIIEIVGAGSGIKFPDGTIQTTASTATAYSRKQEFTGNGTFLVPAAVTKIM